MRIAGVILLLAALSIAIQAQDTASCGNGVCDGGESYLSCSDCPKPSEYYIPSAYCGNEICESGESYLSCSDCPKPASYCGDGVCDGGESYLTCSDCPKPAEYYSVCGNGVCESGESYLSCSDCPKPADYYQQSAYCGNNVCEQSENALNCPEDCSNGECTDSDGGLNFYVKGTATGPVGPGLNVKTTTETDSCNDDILTEYACNTKPSYIYGTPYKCPSGCKDGQCTTTCGNGVCDGGESYLTCSDCPKPVDYYQSGSFCGNGKCEAGESYLSCSDCAKPVEYYEYCGDGKADAGETPENCCVDTGCGEGETCSKIVNKCVLEAEKIPPERIAAALLKVEELRIKIETLESGASQISAYYGSAQNKKRADGWAEVAEIFRQAKLDAENIRGEIRKNKDNMTEKKLEGIRRLVELTNVRLASAIDKILEIE